MVARLRSVCTWNQMPWTLTCHSVLPSWVGYRLDSTSRSWGKPGGHGRCGWDGVVCVQGVLCLSAGRFGVVFICQTGNGPSLGSAAQAEHTVWMEGLLPTTSYQPTRQRVGRPRRNCRRPTAHRPSAALPPQALVKENDGRNIPSQHSVSSSTLRQGSSQPCAGSAPTAAVLPAEQGCVAVLHIACNPGSYWCSPNSWSSSSQVLGQDA